MNKEIRNTLIAAVTTAALVGGGTHAYLQHQDKNRPITTISSTANTPLTNFLVATHNLGMELDRTYTIPSLDLEYDDSVLRSKAQAVKDASEDLAHLLQTNNEDIGRIRFASNKLAQGFTYDRDDHNTTYLATCGSGKNAHTCVKQKYSDSDHIFTAHPAQIEQSGRVLQEVQSTMQRIPAQAAENSYVANAQSTTDDITSAKAIEVFTRAELGRTYNRLEQGIRGFLVTPNISNIVEQAPQYRSLEYNIESKTPDRYPEGYLLVQKQAEQGKELAQDFSTVYSATNSARSVAEDILKQRVPIDQMGETSLSLYHTLGEQVSGRPSKTMQKIMPAILGGLTGLLAAFGLTMLYDQRRN